MNLNATLVGSPAFVPGASGFGQALSLNGTSQYATAPDPGFEAADSWTEEGYFTTLSSAAMLLAGLVKPDGSSANWYVVISAGMVSVVVGGATLSGGSTPYHDGQRHHWRIVLLNGSRAYLLLDGILCDSKTAAFGYSPAAGQTKYFGSYAGQGGFFAGTIEECRASSTGRDYYAFTPPTAPFSSDGTTAALYHWDNDAADSTAARVGTPLVFDGDSITWGAYGTGPSLTTGPNYPATCAGILGSGYYPYNFGVPGQTIEQASADAARQVDALYATGGRLWFEGGINNIIAGEGAATITGALQTYLAARKTAGWTLCVATIHHCGNSAGYFPAGYADIESAVNTWIRANATMLGYTVVDVAANPLLNDPNNATYRNTDQIHFTDAGYTLYGQLAAAAVPVPPAITSPATATATVGQAFNYQITATGSPTRWAAAGLPAGLSIDPATGLISGTPE